MVCGWGWPNADESEKCQRKKGYLLQMFKFRDAKGSLKSEGTGVFLCTSP